jgi:hypothetical protein
MDEWPLVAVMLLIGFVLTGLLVALVVYRKKKGRADSAVDYRSLLALGLCLLPMGLVLSFVVSPGFIGIGGLGAVYVFLGLRNRDRWGG